MSNLLTSEFRGLSVIRITGPYTGRNVAAPKYGGQCTVISASSSLDPRAHV